VKLDNGFKTTIAYHQEQVEFQAIFVASLLPVPPEVPAALTKLW
jgi:hypothetical protein